MERETELRLRGAGLWPIEVFGLTEEDVRLAEVMCPGCTDYRSHDEHTCMSDLRGEYRT